MKCLSMVKKRLDWTKQPYTCMYMCISNWIQTNKQHYIWIRKKNVRFGNCLRMSHYHPVPSSSSPSWSSPVPLSCPHNISCQNCNVNTTQTNAKMASNGHTLLVWKCYKNFESLLFLHIFFSVLFLFIVFFTHDKLIIFIKGKKKPLFPLKYICICRKR